MFPKYVEISFTYNFSEDSKLVCLPFAALFSNFYLSKRQTFEYVKFMVVFVNDRLTDKENKKKNMVAQPHFLPTQSHFAIARSRCYCYITDCFLFIPRQQIAENFLFVLKSAKSFHWHNFFKS